MTLDLSAYLARIGYTGPIKPTREVLRDVHQAHLLAIPYENLDIHLNRPLSLNLNLIFDKLVRRQRGGWCYEMNGLLAWALREAGFEVTLLAGTVGRERLGGLADAGFGNGILEPLPLIEGEYKHMGCIFRLARSDSRWVFHNQSYGGPGFDFTLEPHTLGDFAERCQWLQTSPDSGFVRVAVCHRWHADGLTSLRGAVLQTLTPDGAKEEIVESESDYRHILSRLFALDLGDDVHGLWSKVWPAHLAWASAQPSVA